MFSGPLQTATGHGLNFLGQRTHWRHSPTTIRQSTNSNIPTLPKRQLSAVCDLLPQDDGCPQPQTWTLGCDRSNSPKRSRCIRSHPTRSDSLKNLDAIACPFQSSNNRNVHHLNAWAPDPTLEAQPSIQEKSSSQHDQPFKVIVNHRSQMLIPHFKTNPNQSKVNFGVCALLRAYMSWHSHLSLQCHKIYRNI